MLPHNFPAKSKVHHYFKLCQEKPSKEAPGLLEQAGFNEGL